MKRLSCKWKGQTDADEVLPKARVARLAECHLKQKAGYNQHTSPKQQYSALFLNVLIDMKNNNKSESTITNARKILTQLAKHTSLSEPEAVKTYIANHPTSNGHKRNMSIAYNKYCKYYKIQWTMPLYQPEAQDITLPTTEKLQMLIANARKPTSTKLQLSKETGLRPIELCRLKVKDIDTATKTVHPITAKHGAPRTLKISENLTATIQEHIIKHNLKPNDKIFKGTADDYGKHYRAMRNKLAEKLHDQTLRKIRLYDFRHYFCTQKLYDIQNTYTVMNLMGHKDIRTTQKYMHLLNLEEGQWTCIGATTKEEAMKLIEAGFEYIAEKDGTMLFRKRK